MFCFLRLHPWHMEVPKLGVYWELQLPAYTTATAMWDLSRDCDLHHTSWQCHILNPLSEARDWTCILMDTNRVHFCWARTGTPREIHFWLTGISSSLHVLLKIIMPAAKFSLLFFLLCKVLQNKYPSLSAATDHLLDIYIQLTGEKHHPLSDSSVGGEQAPEDGSEARRENKSLSLEGRELSLRYWSKHFGIGYFKNCFPQGVPIWLSG